MNEAQRHKKLLDFLKTHKTIATAEYVKNFDVSLSTARRDIIKLAEAGKLLKIRNGAEYIPQDEPAGKSLCDMLFPSADGNSKLRRKTKNCRGCI